MLRITRALARETGQTNLCLAGGVALNCVGNGKVLRDGAFENIWVQPAAGDSGGALGAALTAYYHHLGHQRQSAGMTDAMRGAYLGPKYAQGDTEDRLRDAGAVYSVLSDKDVIKQTAQALADEKAVAWMQGRMNSGPARSWTSFLGDPRSPTMQKTLNLKVKYRESFRPFAPSVRSEDAADWFELKCESPYMLMVANIKEDKSA